MREIYDTSPGIKNLPGLVDWGSLLSPDGHVKV